MAKLTKAQARLLRRLSDTPGSAVSIRTIDHGYSSIPTFHGRFHRAACPTCHHQPSESASWRVVLALAEQGMIEANFRGVDYYDLITPAGRAALSTDAE